MPAVRLTLLLLTMSAIANAGSTARELAPNRWTDIPRIVAFGDVHGAYQQLVTALKAAGVVDETLNWSGGDTHLVSLGDLLDRGSESRRAMDLLIRLQSQAPAAGGRVHVVIGNHELMNLTGDMRYVAADEFAAFAEDEGESVRNAAFADYRNQDERNAPDNSTIEVARRDFDTRFPPGYFGHRAHFATRGSYGSWLLRQPLMVVLNKNVFVHGGLPPITARMPLQQINETFASDLAEIMLLGEQLALAGWIRPNEDLLLQDDAVLGLLEAGEETDDPTLVAAGRRFVALVRGELFGITSPNWYRGTANCHRTLEQPVLAAALQNLEAQRVVMGHTPTSNRRVQQRMDGRALLADTGMLTSYYGGQPAPIIFTGADLKILYPLLEQSSDTADYHHPLRIHGLSPEALEELLATAAISVSGPPAKPSGDIPVSIDIEGKPRNVVFKRGSGQANNQKIAAYRLSRLLNLNLVPVTVARSVEGKSGVLVALPAEHISETTRNAAKMGRSNWCGAGNDYQLMYAFDALILNEQRTPETMIYDQQNWQLYLTGHAGSFASSTRTPKYLANIEKVLPGSMSADLASLDEETLLGTLGEQLSSRQIRSLLKRRDRLLQKWSEAPTP